jgi:hypothetical protein
VPASNVSIPKGKPYDAGKDRSRACKGVERREAAQAADLLGVAGRKAWVAVEADSSGLVVLGNGEKEQYGIRGIYIIKENG